MLYNIETVNIFDKTDYSIMRNEINQTGYFFFLDAGLFFLVCDKITLRTWLWSISLFKKF